jgi:hypothetical protein
MLRTLQSQKTWPWARGTGRKPPTGALVPHHSAFCVKLKKGKTCLVPVAHACNPNYSGGRDQEDGGLRPAPAKSLQDPISKKKKKKKRKPPSQKRAGGVAKVKALSSNPSTAKKRGEGLRRDLGTPRAVPVCSKRWVR